MKLAIIIGSTRNGRVGKRVASWVYENIQPNSGFEIEILDIASFNLPFFDEPTLPSEAGGKYNSAVVTKWSQKITQTDAFIFVTPEYNHGLPSPLKNAIDWLYPEWGNKVAGIVSYSSGIGGGIRSAEQLRQVLAHLAVANVQLLVTIPRVQDSLFGDNSAIQQALKSSLTGQIAQLKNWAKALKSVRDELTAQKLSKLL